MIKCIKYAKGEVKKEDFKNINFLRESAWIDCSNPSEDDLKAISDKTEIEISNLKDALDARELPRIQNRLNYSIIIFRVPHLNSIPIGIFIGKKFVVTVHKEDIPFLDNLIKNLMSDTGVLVFKSGLSFLVYRILLEITREFTSTLESVEKELDSLEEHVFKLASEENAKKIFSLKRRLMYIKRSLDGNKTVLEDITRVRFIAPVSFDVFSGLNIEISQIINMEGTYRERLTQIMEIYMMSISNKLNDIMRSFTIIASLLLLPSLIAGIWGMNFKSIFLAENLYGFYYLIIIMIISMIIMYLFFKKKKWV